MMRVYFINMIIIHLDGIKETLEPCYQSLRELDLTVLDLSQPGMERLSNLGTDEGFVLYINVVKLITIRIASIGQVSI